jgi:hypothetical protein
MPVLFKIIQAFFQTAIGHFVKINRKGAGKKGQEAVNFSFFV